jgi:hypothetical protein
MIKPRSENLITIFDHSYLAAQFGQKIPKIPVSMKDHILGSEEFLITANEHIASLLQTHFPQAPQLPDEHSPAENPPIPATQDKHYDLTTTHTGLTPLQILNEGIIKLQTLHNTLYRKKNETESTYLQQISNQLYMLKQQMKQTRNPAEQEQITEEINDTQKKLSDLMEAKEEASRLRISNFYLTGNGTMKPQSFYCTKETNTSRNINKLVVEGVEITDPDEIVNIMQEWYEKTASEDTPQTIPLDIFLQQHQIALPQLDDHQKEELGEEFTEEEVKEALQDATEASASGPSGQSLVFFKLLFTEIPTLFTQALNQLVFVPGLSQSPELQWIRKRKVIYIPKKTNPTTPADFRPLSMLEVLYKIPSRILSKRINRVLPTIIGPHQHGFMRQKGIQEPSIIMTHLIQDATNNNKSLQLLSFDIEKAFDRVTHTVIIQALRAFGFPEIYIQAIQDYILIGYAFVEVNGRAGMLIRILRGSGQGDPMSSSLFLIASEPINLAIIQTMRRIQYTDRCGISYSAVLFADDNLNPLNIRGGQEIEPLLNLYQEYTQVSGLNVNRNKSQALCINTPEQVKEELRTLGIQTPDVLQHLGIQLSTTIENTVQATMEHTDPKLIKRRILATTPPTDLLHRALLINTAYIPIYNHILMALPLSTQNLEELDKGVRAFFWTKQVEGVTFQKRRLVAKTRLPAEHSVGGLQVPLLSTTATSFRLNLLQRIHKRMEHPAHFPPSTLPNILETLLQITGRPTLLDHVERLGPTQWKRTATLLKTNNLLFSQIFLAGAELLKIYEEHHDTWHQAAIVGHTEESIFTISTLEAISLHQSGTTTISQLLQCGENGTLHLQPHEEHLATLHPNLQIKLRRLLQAIINKRPPTQDKWPIPTTPLTFLLNSPNNISTIYRKHAMKAATAQIGIAPAYLTRERDNVYVPERRTFSAAYEVLNLPMMPSKTKETAFQVLNRTIWTNNKAHKSGLREDSDCDYCGEEETMEHLLHGCENYSIKVWEEASRVITALCTQQAGQEVARIQLTPKEIIYNIPHPSFLLFLKEDKPRKALLLLIQEIKRNIVYRRMNIRPGQIGNPVDRTRVIAHILSVVKKLKAMLEYTGILTNKTSISMMSAAQSYLEGAVGG